MTQAQGGQAGVAGVPARPLARRLAAAGLGVQVSRRRDTCQLTIVGAEGDAALD